MKRFTRRAPKDFGDPKGSNAWYDGNTYVKTIANPRRINFVENPHYMNYFETFHSVDENGNRTKIKGHNCPVLANKIVINHYNTKSREECRQKLLRGAADGNTIGYANYKFEDNDRNEVFDDGILKYAVARTKGFRFPDTARTHERVLNALITNLLPTLFTPPPKDFCCGKFETFLTCRAVAEQLKTRFRDETTANFFEESALKAALQALRIGVSLEDMSLFVAELPQLLALPYPAVDELRRAALELIEQLKTVWRLNVRWKDFVELDYLQDILKLGG